MRHLLLLLPTLASCVGPGLLTDGTSVSVGNHATGVLRSGRKLPASGDGYLVPRRWQERDRSFATDELVELLVRSSRRVARVYPRSVLGVADLSPKGGGGSPEHRSHRSGRDVDLLYYMLDEEGKPLPPSEMIFLDDKGVSVKPKLSVPTSPEQNVPTPQPPPPERTLDVPRTWALVRALVSDPSVSVQWIFIGRPLAQLLLQHARRRGEAAYLVERAEAVMHQPSDAQNHMDHWHVRVFCSLSDRYQGCQDRGPARWLKKDLKYLDTPPEPPPLNLAQLALRQLHLGL